jgi:ornithine carbamoyltransferase
MRSFLSITDFNTEELASIMDRADTLRSHWRDNSMPKTLLNKRIALWFLGNGFRNRVAFELGARAMGADISFIPGDLGIQEPLEDVGRYLGNWFDMAVIRCKNHEDLVSISKDSNMPIINARTTFNHPCEIVGDLQFIRKRRGSIDGLNVVFVGEVTNLCMSWFEAAVRFPITVTQVSPEGYELDPSSLRSMNKGAKGRIRTSMDFESSMQSNVDVVYTDCWPRNGDKERIAELFLPYQMTEDILEKMNPDGFFLPCPPVSRGAEVSAESMRSPLCMDYQAKEYLLHAQNAIMEFLIAGH